VAVVKGVAGNSAREKQMSPQKQPIVARKKLLSVDTWAVVLALAAALLIRAGVLNKIPW
jgi:hypothetical protein